MSLYGRKRPASAAAITDINVTPLVDVCLVLVIIFMVIAPMAMQSGIEVASSKVGAAKDAETWKGEIKKETDALTNS